MTDDFERLREMTLAEAIEAFAREHDRMKAVEGRKAVEEEKWAKDREFWAIVKARQRRGYDDRLPDIDTLRARVFDEADWRRRHPFQDLHEHLHDEVARTTPDVDSERRAFARLAALNSGESLPEDSWKAYREHVEGTKLTFSERSNALTNLHAGGLLAALRSGEAIAFGQHERDNSRVEKISQENWLIGWQFYPLLDGVELAAPPHHPIFNIRIARSIIRASTEQTASAGNNTNKKDIDLQHPIVIALIELYPDGIPSREHMKVTQNNIIKYFIEHKQKDYSDTTYKRHIGDFKAYKETKRATGRAGYDEE